MENLTFGGKAIEKDQLFKVIRNMKTDIDKLKDDNQRATRSIEDHVAKYTHLNDQYQVLEQQLAKSDGDLLSAKTELDQTKATLESVLGQANTVQQQDTDAQVTALEEQLAQRDQDLAQHQQQLAQRDQDLAQHQQQLAQHQQQLALLQQTTTDTADAHASQVASLNAQIESLTIQVETSKPKDDVVAELQSKIEDMNASLQRKAEEAYAEKDAEILAMKQQLEQLTENTASQIQSAVASKDARISELEGRVKQLETENESMEARCRQAEVETGVFEEKRQSMVGELEKTNADLSLAKEAVVQLEQRYAKLEADHAEQLEAVNRELEDAKTAQHSREQIHAQQENEELRAQLEEARRSVSDQVQQETQILREELESLRNDKDPSSDVQALEQQVATLEQQVQAAERQVADLESARDVKAQEATEYENKANEATDTIAQLQVKLEGAQTAYATLETTTKSELDAAADMITELEDKAMALERQVKDSNTKVAEGTEEELEDLREQIASLRAAMAKQNDEVAALQASLDVAVAAQQAQQEHIATVEQDKQQAIDRVAREEVQSQDFARSVAELHELHFGDDAVTFDSVLQGMRKSLEDRKQQMGELQTRLVELEGSAGAVEELQARIVELESSAVDAGELQTRIVELEGSIAAAQELQEKLQAATEQVAQVDAEKQCLQNELNELRNKEAEVCDDANLTQAKLASLEGEHEALKKVVEKLRAELADAQAGAEARDLEHAKNVEQSQQERAQEMELLGSQVAELKAQLGEQQDENAKLHEEMANEKDHVSAKLGSELSRAQDAERDALMKAEAKVTECDSLQDRLCDLEVELAQEVNRKNGALAEFDKAIESLTRKEIEYHELEEKVQVVEGERDATKRELEMVREKKVAQDKMLDMYQSGIATDWAMMDVNDPLPPFGLDSPVIQQVFQSWTDKKAKIKLINNWCQQVLSGDAHKKSFTKGVELSNLPQDVCDGFVKLVVPVLQQRSDTKITVHQRTCPHVFCELRLKAEPKEATVPTDI